MDAQLFPDCRVIGHDAVVPQAPADHPDFWPIWRDIVKPSIPSRSTAFSPARIMAGASPRRPAPNSCSVGPRADPNRSASAIRADPWGAGAICRRRCGRYYARTICLHGPESTGKSTLAAPLARSFRHEWMPEYGRVHCELFGFDLDAAGLIMIADVQQRDDRRLFAPVQPAPDRRYRRAHHRRLVADDPRRSPGGPDHARSARRSLSAHRHRRALGG